MVVLSIWFTWSTFTVSELFNFKIIFMERNVTEEELREEVYLGNRIESYKKIYEEFDILSGKWVKKKLIVCLLYCYPDEFKFINLRECNDGSPFTSVNQAVNQAKSFVDTIRKTLCKKSLGIV